MNICAGLSDHLTNRSGRLPDLSIKSAPNPVTGTLRMAIITSPMAPDEKPDLHPRKQDFSNHLVKFLNIIPILPADTNIALA